MADSTVTYTNIEDQLLLYNQQAMELLRARNFVIALTYLTKAEQLLTHCNELKNRFTLESITWNNLGCFYKRTYKPSLALHYLKKALSAQEKCKAEIVSVAGTHLNLCTIYSYIDTHDQAIKHALRALSLLESEPARTPNHITTLVIAYYNAGVELELLAQIPKALQMYEKGLDLANCHLGKKHDLTISLQKNYSKLASKSDSKSSSRVSTRSSGRKKPKHSFDHLSLSPKPNKLPSLSTQRRKKSNYSLGSSTENSYTDYSAYSTSREWEQNELNITKYLETSKPQKPRKSASAVPPVKDLKLRENALSAPARTTKEVETTRVYVLQKHKIYRDHPSTDLSPAISSKSSYTSTPKSTPLKPSQAAVRIQTAWRRYKERTNNLKKLMMNDPYLVMKAAIEELDKLKKIHTEEKLLMGLPPLPTNICTNKLSIHPKEFRLSKPRTSLEPIPEVKRESKMDKIKCIQSHIRGWLARLRYKREKEAVVKIQSYVRMWQTLNLYRDIQAAVVHIQRTWREYRERKKTSV